MTSVRHAYLDWVRGVAVLVMVEAHVLDSWTRPTYARLNGRKAADSTIERRFRAYGPYAGLAFWLFLTRDWVEDDG